MLLIYLLLSFFGRIESLSLTVNDVECVYEYVLYESDTVNGNFVVVDHDIFWGFDHSGIDMTDTLGENPNENMEDRTPTLSTEEVTNPNAASRTSEESDTPRAEKDATSLKASKSEEERSEMSLVWKLQMPGNMCSPPALFGRVISCREPAERRTKELVLL